MAKGTKTHVVIVGGGFGGLYAARALERSNLQMTLVDRRNHPLFQPLLYQVATATLSPGDIAYPIRAIDPREARVLLVEAGPRILSAYPEDLSAKAEASLKKLAVEVRKNCAVTSVEPAWVGLGNEKLQAVTVLWAAGVTASPLAKSLGVPL